MYVNINEVPKFLGTCDADVSTDSFYWNSRLIGALANASYKTSLNLIERYQLKVHGKCHEIINRYDEELKNAKAGAAVKISEKANNETAKMVQEETRKVLNQVLKEASNVMKNSYARSDA
jgi:dipeptidase